MSVQEVQREGAQFVELPGCLGGGQTGPAELWKHGREAVVREWDVGFCGFLEVELLWMQIEPRA